MRFPPPITIITPLALAAYGKQATTPGALRPFDKGGGNGYRGAMSFPRRFAAALPLLLAAAPAPPLMPGAWEETVVFALDSVNGSTDLAARMAKALPNPQPHQSCLTAGDLKNPQGIFLAGAEQSCRFARFTMMSGKIDAAGDCSNGEGQTMHVEGSGSYTATGYDFTFKGSGQAGKLTLVFRGRDSGRRVGVCTAF
jgi:hypothetical protein